VVMSIPEAKTAPPSASAGRRKDHCQLKAGAGRGIVATELTRSATIPGWDAIPFLHRKPSLVA